MLFFLDHSCKPHSRVTLCTLDKAKLPDSPEANTLYFWPGRQKAISIELDQGKLLILGDPVFESEEKLKKTFQPEATNWEMGSFYEEVKGHYYWFFIYPEGIFCGTSFGAIFPLYYHFDLIRIMVSSSLFHLAKIVRPERRDRRHLLERLLFNYSFFDSTWWEGIKLLGTHQYLAIKVDGVRIENNLNMADHFGSLEDSSRGALSRLSDLFMEETRKFLPDEPFAISLTGGFDGRTLVAAAKNAGYEFPVFCYGKSRSSDLLLSAYLAKRLDIPHLSVVLDEKYLQNEAFPSALDFLRLSEYNGNLGRPHYLYSARLLAKKLRYIVTGNFGSELFRAFHTPGVMLSRCLIEIFAQKSDVWKDILSRTTRIYAPDGDLNSALDALIVDIEDYLASMKGWQENRKFYYFVYTEVFRKYFGAELVVQSHFLNNRTPFLNLRLIKEINRTKWAGVHSRLFEKNLYKRRKGQVFYADFLQRTNMPLYLLKTNKGYRPIDVLEPWRTPFLLWGVISSKLLHREIPDPHSVDAFFIQNYRSFYEQIMRDDLLPFLKNKMNESLAEMAVGAGLGKWNKFYSITLGWQVAKTERSIAG